MTTVEINHLFFLRKIFIIELAMNSFEFQFNPKVKTDRFFEVFSFETDRKLPEQGNLYMVGELINALPSNAQFLKRLAFAIKDAYDAQRKQKNVLPGIALKTALKKANEFLDGQTKNGNVDWLGNLHFALLGFFPGTTGYLLYLAKVGQIHVWMARNGTLIDVGKNLEDVNKHHFQSAKVFGNVMSGKATWGDRIFVCTKELFEFFSQENIFPDLAWIQEQKQFQKLFKSKEKELRHVSGILFGAQIESNNQAPLRTDEKLPVTQRLFPLRIPALKLKGTRYFASLPKLIPRTLLPSAISRKTIGNLFRFPFLKRNALLLFFFLLLLLGGFLVFQAKNQQLPKKTQPVLAEVRNLRTQAENAINLGNKEEATLLFQKALEMLLSYTKKEGFANDAKRAEVQLQREQIEEQLFTLHNVQTIENPKALVEIPQDQQTSSDRLIFHRENLYLFQSSTSRVSVFHLKTNSWEALSAGKNIKDGIPFLDTILFLGESPLLLFLERNHNFTQTLIAPPHPDFRFNLMGSYAKNLYLLDSNTGEITKYQNPLSGNALPTSWIDPLSEKRPLAAKAMTLDSNIWILTKDNEIQKYFKGRYQESFKPVIFPSLENPTRLKTKPDLPHLYLLDPSGNRVIILTKSGEVIKQYRSSAFDHLLDFEISPDGKIIYLLNGAKIYEVSVI